ncbi:hypothetical protein V2J09_020273 [Rumex salicifolius]
MAPPPPPSSPLSSCSSSSNSPHILFHRSNHFIPVTIEEGNESNEEESSERCRIGSLTPPSYHNRTPIYHHKSSPGTTIGAIIGARLSEKSRPEKVSVTVTFNKCRPNTRDKMASYVVPSPNRIFKSIVDGLARMSPKPSFETSSTCSPAVEAKENQWKMAAEELSRKLAEATRKRDEAIVEASELKYSMAELEKKLNKLEIYCHSIRSGFEVVNRHGLTPFSQLSSDGNDRIINEFLISVAGARTAVRSLSRALTVQIRQMGAKVFERISSLYLEALLNSSLFEGFELTGFTESSSNRILNPLDRCEAQYAAFSSLQGLTWEEVLSKGTKHFSEDFSRFCDRKMGQIVGSLGLGLAWPESLLQAFFDASKSVWLVHLLANSVHPGLAVFRVEKGSVFDSVYMEDMGEDRAARSLVPTVIRIMVAPGFYVYDSVIKCKILYVVFQPPRVCLGCHT